MSFIEPKKSIKKKNILFLGDKPREEKPNLELGDNYQTLKDRIDKINFSIHGIPSSRKVPDIDLQAPLAKEAFSLIANTVFEQQKLRVLDAPVHIRHKSSLLNKNLNNSPLIAVLLGEQHQGGNYKGITFKESNQAISKVLYELYNKPELNLGDAIHEGCMKLLINDSDLEKNFEDFLKTNSYPLNTAMHLMMQKTKLIETYAADSISEQIKFILAVMLFNSVFGVYKDNFHERQRLLKILDSNMSPQKRKLINLTLCEIIEELKIESLIEKEILTFYNHNHFRILEKTKDPESKELKLKLKDFEEILESYIYFISKERDDTMVKQFLRFRKGIHPILVGANHIENMIKLFEKRNIPVIVLSPF